MSNRLDPVRTILLNNTARLELATASALLRTSTRNHGTGTTTRTLSFTPPESNSLTRLLCEEAKEQLQGEIPLATWGQDAIWGGVELAGVHAVRVLYDAGRGRIQCCGYRLAESDPVNAPGDLLAWLVSCLKREWADYQLRTSNYPLRPAAINP